MLLGARVSEVVSLQPAPQKKDMCLVCDCGSVTFRIMATGDFECSACGEWLEDDISAVDYAKVQEIDRHIQQNIEMGAEDLAMRRVASKVEHGLTAALVVMNKNGVTHVWSEGADGRQDAEDWFQQRVDELMGQLV